MTEGQATILQQGNSVFYNKAQVVNRDISNAVLRWFIALRQQEAAKPKRTHKATMPHDTPLKARSLSEHLAAAGQVPDL